MSMMLEAEKKQAAEQAKMLEMDLEVHEDTLWYMKTIFILSSSRLF